MKTIRVNTARPYDIQIGQGLLEQAGERCRAALPRAGKIAVVTDSTVAPLYLETVADSLRAAGFQVFCQTVPAGEGSKNTASLSALWESFMEFGLTRTDAVAALGGGMVGDLAGFAAATILRGIDYVQIPTTLLAQVDSSVGGKVAIDLQAGKNLAGAFWQPSLVLMDTDTLRTLPDRDFSSGMAEVIKYGCIADRAFFDFLTAHASREAILAEIESVLYTCCDIKRKVVEEDERDTGLRMILNFGHTVGHAYERMGNYETWTHGEAVAAGMCAAVQIGFGLGVSGGDDSGIQELMDLLEAFHLPTQIPLDTSEAWNAVVEAVGLDKKGTGDELTMIFLKRMGEALPVKQKKDSVLENLEAIYGR
ncbi:MAG: 3-dehydroquinate synthase [Oscillibacter sp.]|nr:3-dehydroquinate synthase [Oscillibacter sp.]